MDSLTQIVLGAAVGEAVLGRKVGNRAMLWGGIAGTLPDLDVLSGLVTDPMSALAYHRAFTHSLPFAIFAAPIIGITVHRMYGGRIAPRLSGPVVYPLATLCLYFLLLVGSLLMPVEVYGVPLIAAVITLFFAALCLLVGLIRYLRRHRSPPTNTGWKQWTLLFFLAIVTHPLLDCFTSYGTQFFEPFSRLRIAWNTVSVVDPLYTLPFLILLLLAAFRGRESRVRRKLNTAGLLLSSAYLLFTVVNAFHVGAIVDDTLTMEGIAPTRSVHSPTLGNNLLWSATVQSGDTYHLGQYSLLDRERRFQPLVRVAGNHALLEAYVGDRELEILRWFSDGYYTVIPRDSGRVQFNDLRYGLLGDDPTDPSAFIFSWTIDTTVHPVRVIQEDDAGRGDPGAMLGNLWTRIWGI